MMTYRRGAQGYLGDNTLGGGQGRPSSAVRKPSQDEPRPPRPRFGASTVLSLLLLCVFVAVFSVFIINTYQKYEGDILASNIHSWSIEPLGKNEPDEKTMMMLVDCDGDTMELVLNAWMCWANVRGDERAANEFTVLCLNSQCCNQAKLIGLKTVGHGDMFEMYLENRKGFKAYPQRSPLDDVQFVRELIVQQLLYAGFSVIRADADACFTKDPMALVKEHSMDIVISAQYPGERYVNTKWRNNYACPGDPVQQFLTLNNGVAYLAGNQKVASLYARAVGRSLRILSEPGTPAENKVELASNGYAQKGMNEELRSSDFCFRNAEIYPQSNTWNGKVLVSKTNYTEMPNANVDVSIFSVCSPCDEFRYCGREGSGSPSYLVHANCRLGDQKREFLKSQQTWFLRGDWASLLQNPNRMDLKATLALLRAIR